MTLTPGVDAIFKERKRVRKMKPHLYPLQSEPHTSYLTNLLRASPDILICRLDAEYHLQVSSISFKEFSFCEHSPPSFDQINGVPAMDLPPDKYAPLAEYLERVYKVTKFVVKQPFIYLESQPENHPPEFERPFQIAGSICVWVRPGETQFYTQPLGFVGQATPHELSESLAKELRDFNIPCKEAMLELMRNHFPYARAISRIWDQLIIESPEVDDLTAVPGSFSNLDIKILYRPGPLPYTETRAPVKQLDPPRLDAKALEEEIVKLGFDQHTYINHRRYWYPKEPWICGELKSPFSPGAMLRAMGLYSSELCAASAGVMIDNGLSKVLTGTGNCWPPSYRSKLAPCYITQGTTGTYYRRFREPYAEAEYNHLQVEDTYGLAIGEAIDACFENTLMGTQFKFQKLLPSTEVRIGDDFLIDAFTTGLRRLKCTGARYTVQTHADAPPTFASHHLVFAVNEPRMVSDPTVREGMCGAALVRCGQGKYPRVAMSTLLLKGLVAGAVATPDLYSTALLAPLYCYVESFDALRARGWDVTRYERGKLSGWERPRERGRRPPGVEKKLPLKERAEALAWEEYRLEENKRLWREGRIAPYRANDY
ncbi:MAG: hypothetical protein M1829_003338 [Trizodia sp. TS-e1964]|nr:MAG: hypothetical protein M1829_003338 [Trizodia sp. TS-e1964]